MSFLDNTGVTYLWSKCKSAFAPLLHTHSEATTSASGMMSASDKDKLDNTNVAYGTCETAAATAAKVVALSGNTQWQLKNGSMIMVKFTNSNTASSVTLNVNSTGAYPIWYNNAEYTSNGTAYTGYAGRTTTYMFDGSHWVWISNSYDANTQSNTNSTNTSSKIFLVGATSQGSSKTTYSHDTVYAGTDGHVYSNSKQAVNLSDSQALTNKTYNGYTLADACAKGVDTSATSGSSNLITSGAMYTALSGKASTSVATTSANGLMSSTDKTKLDGIATGANAYTHPSYTARTGVPTANATLSHGGTFTVTQPVSDATGHITAMNTRTYTMPSETTLSKGTDATASKSLSFGGTFTAVTDTSVSGHAITDTTTTYTMPSDRLFVTLTPSGTAISTTGTDLNQIAYLKVGRYYCSANATAKTLLNCPTSIAFMMEVYSPLSPTVDNEETATYVYRLRKLTEYSTGKQYIQYCASGSTAGTFTYKDWYVVPIAPFTLDSSDTNDGSGTVGATTQPVYLNDGVVTAGSTYAGGTAVTLNGSSKAASTASFYAPTSAGTSGYILKSAGSGAPTWLQTLPIANGGTGSTTASGALTNLGLTATATELNYCDGVTSNIQTQLNAKASSSHTHDYLPLSGGTLSGALTIVNESSNGAINMNNASGTALKVMGIGSTDNLGIGAGLYNAGTGATIVYGGTSVQQTIPVDGTAYGTNFTTTGESSYPVAFRPTSNGKAYLGTSSYKWYKVYASTSSIQTSDERAKENIVTLDENHSALFDKLRPVEFMLKEGNGRKCYGLVAQEVEKAMQELGIAEDELDLVQHDFWTDEETGKEKDSYGIAYNNLIAMLIKEVQDLKAEVKELKAKSNVA